uniref:Uncharacterized protein n=1 Tax=Arundo donax TaxID=35708 RepID=A0A0A8ZBK5_ARUDO
MLFSSLNCQKTSQGSKHIICVLSLMFVPLERFLIVGLNFKNVSIDTCGQGFFVELC